MVEERLARPDVRDGFILDGYPRTLAQAVAVDEILARLGRRITGASISTFPIRRSLTGCPPASSAGLASHLTT